MPTAVFWTFWASYQLIKFGQRFLDGGEIREIGSLFKDFRVAYDPRFIDDEGGPHGDAVHIEYEILVKGSVGRGGGFVKIAEQGEVEVLFFLEFSQGEDGVDAYGEDLGIGLVIKGDVVACAAEFFCAGAGEGLGKEKQEDVLAFIVAEGYFLFVGIEQAKVGRRLAGLDAGRAHG